MGKQNCWGFQNCGRAPGGAKVHELGVCPAAIDARGDGVHGGKNGGRACWMIAGTFCGGKTQGTFCQKLASCIECQFYQLVEKEEGADYLFAKVHLSRDYFRFWFDGGWYPGFR